MQPEILIDNASVTLMYHPDTKIVHHEFHTFMHGAPFRDALTRGCEVMKSRGGDKWLSDDRMNSALGPDDTQWAQNEWFPAVKKAGWKHWAVVMPGKVVGQLNMKQWIAMYSKLGINAQMFDDPDKALAWLAAQK